MEAAELERVRRARNGDAEAFRGIVEAYSGPLWRAAFRVLDDSAAAEDAVQDAFLHAWRALDRFDEQAELSTWLYRITINAAIDLRRERKRLDAEEDDHVREQAVFALSQLKDGTDWLLKVLRSKRDPETIRRALFWLGQSDDPRAFQEIEKILDK